MSDALLHSLREATTELKSAGLYKSERTISSPQQPHLLVSAAGSDADVVNFCANNYLGLANHPAVISAAHDALDRYGYGMASVRFICGTQTIHKDLEALISEFVGTQDTILYPSCFDANGGLFETLLGPDDAVISDELNHASIIDGIRLSKARRVRYRHNDMDALEQALQAQSDARARLIVTDGVFSMDGTIANLADIVALAKKYDALTMIDDCHATGFLGEQGRGTHEHTGVFGQIDIITGTLGKALGGASGGFTAASREIVDWLRQRSRPYLFSNSVAPVICASSIAVMELIAADSGPRRALAENAARFRQGMTAAGFDLKTGRTPDHPGYARRRACGQHDGGKTAGPRPVCDRLLLPGRAAGPGAYSHTDVRRPHAGRRSIRH